MLQPMGYMRNPKIQLKSFLEEYLSNRIDPSFMFRKKGKSLLVSSTAKCRHYEQSNQYHSVNPAHFEYKYVLFRLET